jgi:DNA-binding beta-propeller fold protein YncE
LLIANFATAAVVLLALGLVLGPLGVDRGGFGWGGTDKPKTIPAALVQATPTPSVEFVWQSSGDPADPIENATNLAIAPDGTIWVPDGRNARFQILSPEGELLEVWGSEGTGEGQFDFLLSTSQFGGYGKSAIAFAPDGSFYVADTGNFRIQKFGPDRAFVTAWGSEGTDDGQFLGIADLAVDSQGRVYVLDPYRGFDSSSAADAVQLFDADGHFLATWGAQGSEPGQMMHAVGITADRDGTILIADYQNNRVQRFTHEGEYLDSWGAYGMGEGQFNGPLDVAVDAEGHVFEVDYANNRVQVFDRDGRFLLAWGKYGFGEGEFFEPANVAVDGEGNVYVTEVGGRVQKFRVQL